MRSPLLLAILSALGACSETYEGTACLPETVTEDATCPQRDEVPRDRLQIVSHCGDIEVDRVLSDGKPQQAGQAGGIQCCYRVEIVDHEPNAKCEIGRPYFEAGVATQAALRAEQLGSARARAWAEAGQAEHASVAAFARLALQLMAHAAPTELLRRVQQAGLDEVGHAELCWRLAERFGARRIEPSAFPFAGAIALGDSLAEVAAAAAREGCLTETLGAHVASAAAELASEPDVKAALTTIATEESAHAVTSYLVVAWALQVGGAHVERAVRAALAEPFELPSFAELSLRSGVEQSALAAAATSGLRQVVEPAIEQLLAGVRAAA